MKKFTLAIFTSTLLMFSATSMAASQPAPDSHQKVVKKNTKKKANKENVARQPAKKVVKENHKPQ